MTKRIGSNRMRDSGDGIFAEMTAWRREAELAGLDIIDLGIGSPDRPPSDEVKRVLAEAALRDDMYGYPQSAGSPPFREAAAEWLKHRFGVDADPATEIAALMGSQDGLAHVPIALADAGDTVIVPDPAYPIYHAAMTLANLRMHKVPLVAERGYLPALDDIPDEVCRKARFMLLSYPNNPTAAIADRAFFEEWLAFGRKHDIVIVHDLAYSELAFDGHRPISILELPGAKEIAVELHSLSKSFQMAGCRIGFMAGNAAAVQALKAVKSNIDYGTFQPVQLAGIHALRADMARPFGAAETYRRRRDAFIGALAAAGWPIPVPQATMFAWAPIPDGWQSRQISREILRSTGVVVTPGDAFGELGEGYVRISLVQEEGKLTEAARRLASFYRSAASGR